MIAADEEVVTHAVHALALADHAVVHAEHHAIHHVIHVAGLIMFVAALMNAAVNTAQYHNGEFGLKAV